jgi:YVTN family beta-propeller protein
MEFRILGPLEVADDGRLLSLGSGRQLALVGLLLLHRNEVVSTERLVDELWGESPPPTAGKIVRNSVSLLRKELGERLVTRPSGYLLRVEPGELDAERLERAVEDANIEQLNAALALWRGAPLAQLAYQSFAQREIARLEELHLAAIEARIEAELELGREGNLVSELEALVREHPLRERLRGQLMLALYRSGRQSEALQAYQDARRALTAELGLEPGPELQRLQKAILNQDTTLESPLRATRQASRRRGGLLIVAGAFVLLAGGIAAAVVELTGGSSAQSLSSVAANSVGVIDPKTNRIVAQVPVNASPTGLAQAGGSVWVLNIGANTVSRIDAGGRVVVRVVPLPGPADAIAADESGAWVVYVRSGSGLGTGSAGAAFVDTRFNDVTRTVVLNRLFEGGDAIALGAGSVWAADRGFVTRIDPATGRILALIHVDSTGNSGVAVGDVAIWALGFPGVVRIDPATNTIVATIPVAQNVSGGGPSPTALAVGAGAVWVANRFVVSGGSLGHLPPTMRGTVSRIDPATNAVVATIPVGHDPFGIAADDGAVWVANRTGFTVSRIDPRTNRVVATIRIGNRPQGIAVGAGAVWVAVG